jgi:hypothetical protein
VRPLSGVKLEGILFGKIALFSLRNAASGTVFHLSVLLGASACIIECIGSSHRTALIATRSVPAHFFCLFLYSCVV